MRRLLFILVSGILTALTLSGCGTEEVTSGSDGITDPPVTENEISAFAGNNGDFAFDLYQKMKSKDGNLLFSPYSLSAVLAMTYAGARGETEQEMADALHFALPQERLHPAFNNLEKKLAEQAGETSLRLHVSNALWGQNGYKFLPDFLNTLAENYGAGMKLVDYVKSPETARTTINDWVSEQTEKRIEELIPPGNLINPLTRLVLTNTVYFSAEWEHMFHPPDCSRNQPFYRKDGTEISVPTMQSDYLSLPYTRADIYQAVEMPYKGGNYSMLVLLPDTGRFDEFEESLDLTRVNRIIDAMEETRLWIELPRFSFEADFLLKEALSAMGMAGVFSEGADFSGMTGKRDLFIEDVVHISWISVDEAGTEVTVASAVPVMMGMEESVHFAADRPFIFLIRDTGTGTILFAGRVLNPLE